jgi:hypothetical protein
MLTPSKIKFNITTTQSKKQLRTRVFCDNTMLVVSTVTVVSKKKLVPSSSGFQEVHHPLRTS